ncbi:MAG: Uncharacterised protein [Gammaproteobacteria bacterium]|nr:MAG: Uncharacterised protein [Gammaproteobacteria bacterium]
MNPGTLLFQEGDSWLRCDREELLDGPHASSLLSGDVRDRVPDRIAVEADT